MAKIKVAVIFGGKSSEHDVSVVSATHVINSIPKDKFDIICIGITKKGNWFQYMGPVEYIASGEWENHPDNVHCILSPDPVHRGFIAMRSDGTYQNVKVDCVFPVLHGKNGEDGTIQGLFQLCELPFVGCDMISSANCMDKSVTHMILEANGIKTAKWVTILEQDLDAIDAKCDEMESRLKYPMFVKPANCGSSFGISKVGNLAELKAGIKMAFSHDKIVVVEEGVVGLEVECAVMGNANPIASTIGEIEAANDFYDYDAKYDNVESHTYIPARISDEDINRIRQEAIKGYKAMGCEGMARVDFFLCESGDIILNEINTIPGHTSISMYPQLMQHSGMTPAQQEENLIKLAFERADVDYE